MSKPASIQKIKAKHVHPNADKIEIVEVLGWRCIVSKSDNINVGDLVLYVEVDSVTPDMPQFELLRLHKFRVTTSRFRGEYSQGLVLPLSKFPELSKYNEGDDVSKILGVTHYEKPVPTEMGFIAPFPENIIPVTDEENYQNIPNVLDWVAGRQVYVSLKLDGTSMTVISTRANFTTGVKDIVKLCSRRMELDTAVNNNYTSVFNSNGLMNLEYGYAVQGELVGPKIQGNKLKLSKPEFFVFNVFDINSRRYFGLEQMQEFCAKRNLKTVPILHVGDVPWKTALEMQEYANKLTYKDQDGKEIGMAEGCVVRLVKPDVFKYPCPISGRMISFKVISQPFQIKYE